jgi:hypothetical protein
MRMLDGNFCAFLDAIPPAPRPVPPPTLQI